MLQTLGSTSRGSRGSFDSGGQQTWWRSSLPHRDCWQTEAFAMHETRPLQLVAIMTCSVPSRLPSTHEPPTPSAARAGRPTKGTRTIMPQSASGGFYARYLDSGFCNIFIH
eukprot:750506-Hanusia_phi.AAC.8